MVVIASGTNDWHSVPPLYTLDEWLAEAVAFLQQVAPLSRRAPCRSLTGVLRLLRSILWGRLQVSTAFSQPTIILQVFPPEQQLAGVLNGAGGVNETMQYIQAMPSLFTQVSLCYT